MSPTPPRLSVVIAGSPRPTDLPEILRQAADKSVEVLVAYAGEPGTEETEMDPAVKTVRARPEANLPEILGMALARARGDLIAITDSRSGVHEHWIPCILEAHESGDSIIGGAVEPEGLKTLVDWSAYFCDYGQFMLPLRTGEAGELPGNNLSIKRPALASGRKFVEGEFWKTYWCQAAKAAGYGLHSTPAIVVSYRKRFRLQAYLNHRFHNGRCFAGMRNREVTTMRRLIYAAGSPLLPFLSSWRVFRNVAPKGRHLGRLIFALPLVFLATVSWSAGEFLGYIRGTAGSCRHVR